MSELVDHVDADDHVLGVVERATAVRLGLLHRIVGVVCRDGDGRYLVHRRPGTAPWLAGMYGAMLGGGVRAGESYERAAVREIREEIGLDLPVRSCFTILCRGAISPYWFAVHETVVPADVQIAPNPKEFAWIGWLDEEALRHAAARLPFVPEIHEAFTLYQRHLNERNGNVAE
ncbi:Isopentenyldiphosphate isomerase [Nonomuraea solani]|uniref:Isopentenyldiphosphate isomerase n=1 Tax=Nonomuraea solani TaxID=1144553 RepID=A0A1H5ZNH9_9ACTN|nr:NUDIX domain-containing protein [Nonomuraea solani]SEG36946.1 Isopentenyldiphosphate isomerase [Nonomuraea solani]